MTLTVIPPCGLTEIEVDGFLKAGNHDGWVYAELLGRGKAAYAAIAVEPVKHAWTDNDYNHMSRAPGLRRRSV